MQRLRDHEKNQGALPDRNFVLIVEQPAPLYRTRIFTPEQLTQLGRMVARNTRHKGSTSASLRKALEILFFKLFNRSCPFWDPRRCRKKGLPVCFCNIAPRLAVEDEKSTVAKNAIIKIRQATIAEWYATITGANTEENTLKNTIADKDVAIDILQKEINNLKVNIARYETAMEAGEGEIARKYRRLRLQS